MPRRKTAFIEGNYYHLYNRGHNRQTIFFTRENYLFFLRQLRRYLVEQAVYLNAYCLMPNHYHLLVCVRQENVSEQMGLLSLSYTKAINRQQQRCGGLFQGPFQSIWVSDESYLLQLSRYIHLNPVKAGLVERAEDWEFSSYQDYVALRRGKLPQFEKIRGWVGMAQAYRAFVEAEQLVQPELQELMLDE